MLEVLYMKKKILAVCTLLCMLLCGCQSKPEIKGTPEKAAQSGKQTLVAGKELFMLADTEEKAKETAELYGIKLVEFDYGVATFHTEEDPNEVIRRGRENNWPELSLNRIEKLSDPIPTGSKAVKMK